MAAGPGIREGGGKWLSPTTGGLGVGAGRRWLGVEFRHLGALAAVAREGSFRRAAESLGYVQSAISGQIAHLERVVGTQLVERSSGTTGTTLTAAGQVLLSHVDEILARFEAARMDVRALADGTDLAVRIGVLDGLGPRRLARIVTSFADGFPDAPVQIHESDHDEHNFDRLANGQLDLMISELPLPDGPFDYMLLERDAYVLLVAADSPLAKHVGPPTSNQLEGMQLLLPVSSRGEDKLVVKLRETGVHQQPSLRLRSIASLQAAAGAGLGVAVIPALAVDRTDPATVAIEAPSLLPERMVVLVMHREREYSAQVRGFIEIVRESFGEPRVCEDLE